MVVVVPLVRKLLALKLLALKLLALLVVLLSLLLLLLPRRRGGGALAQSRSCAGTSGRSTRGRALRRARACR